MGKKRKTNLHECSEFKEKYTKKIAKYLVGKEESNYEQSYYKIMGELIQQAHESKKIDLACRDLVFFDLRSEFVMKKAGKEISNSELSHYGKTSDYPEAQIDALFNVGRAMHDKGISYQNLDSYANKMADAADKQKQDPNNIPKVIHSIWLTNPSSPRELFKSDIKNIISNKKFFEKDGEKWSYIIWTNDKKLIPKSVKSLEKNNIEVRSIDDYKSEISLFDEILSLVKNNKFGMASDILRYELLFNDGGVYADLNYKFLQSIKNYLKKYDFIMADFQNNFFAAKKNHEILRDALDEISADWNPIQNLFWKQTVGITHIPYVLSIIKNANKHGNIDFYHDYYYAYGLDDIGPLGQDNIDTAGTWREL